MKNEMRWMFGCFHRWMLTQPSKQDLNSFSKLSIAFSRSLYHPLRSRKTIKDQDIWKSARKDSSLNSSTDNKSANTRAIKVKSKKFYESKRFSVYREDSKMWVATLSKWRYLRGKWTRGRGILLQMLGEISRKTLPRYQILFIQIYDISIKVLVHLDIKARIKMFPIITAVLEQSYLKRVSWSCIFLTRLKWNCYSVKRFCLLNILIFV